MMEEALQPKTDVLSQETSGNSRQVQRKAEVQSQVWKVGGFLGGHERVLEDCGISEECEII